MNLQLYIHILNGYIILCVCVFSSYVHVEKKSRFFMDQNIEYWH